MVVLLLPDDPEQAIIDELTPTFTIGTSFPEALPAVFLRVNGAGGFQRDLVTDTFTVVLEAYAKLETTAHAALSEAIARLANAQQLDGRWGAATVYRLQVVSLPQNLPHPDVPSHKRYISTLAPDLRRRSTTL